MNMKGEMGMKKMKKILNRNKSKKEPKKIDKVTNKTVAEHREKIIATGKSFKYPIQYTKTRLVVVAFIIGLVMVVGFFVYCWWQLYRVQTTSDFFYKITQFIPAPVAKVEGKSVSYGDYLLNYRPSESFLKNQNLMNEDYNGQKSPQAPSNVDYYKAIAMRDAVKYVYAKNLPEGKNIDITDKDAENVLRETYSASSEGNKLSDRSYDDFLEKFFGLNRDDVMKLLKMKLFVKEVSYSIDDKARNKSNEIANKIKANPNKPLSEIIPKEDKKSIQALESGWVKKTNHDGGLAMKASKLKKGQASAIPVKSYRGDGYYFVRLIDTKNDDEINYEYVRIPLTVFEQKIRSLYKGEKIEYYIDVYDINKINKPINKADKADSK